jgi:hypothetical protein
MDDQDVLDAAAGRVGQRAERPVERHILRHMANHMQRHRASQRGVSEGREHGAECKAWVARLATPNNWRRLGFTDDDLVG